MLPWDRQKESISVSKLEVTSKPKFIASAPVVGSPCSVSWWPTRETSLALSILDLILNIRQHTVMNTTTYALTRLLKHEFLIES